MATNVVINGSCGRMGLEIARIVLGDPATRLEGCVEVTGHPRVGTDIGSLLGMTPQGVTVADKLDDLPLERSVLIDFSAPSSTEAILKILDKRVSRLVVGTTGLTEPQLAALRSASQRMPVVHSSNMSLGVNLLFYLTGEAAKLLGSSFDIEIIEAHHHHKKDAPSGTARRLGEIAAAAIGRTYRDAVVDGRSGIVGERPHNEIGMHAVRGGDIVGDHTVLFAGNGERIELRHMAHSRATLAQGAVTAAKWLAGRHPGLYTMADVLGLPSS